MRRHILEPRSVGHQTPLGASLLALSTMLLASLVIFLASSASSSIAWRGDLETGNFSQWASIQAKDPSRVTIVQSPLRQGHYAARFEVRSGDNNVAGSGTGERAEVYAGQAATDGYEGHEAYWAWSTYFDPSFASVGNWDYFTQFHHTGSTGQASVGFIADGSMLKLRVCNGVPDTPTCQYWTFDSNRKNGQWYDFVFHVKWSSDPTVGSIELWENGQRVIPLTHIATLYPGQGVYIKQGFYRGAQTNTAVLYDDGTRRGSSYDEVAAEFPSSSSTPFGVTSNIATGSTLSGTVPWTATPSGKTASSVTFSVDGSPVGTDTTAPFGISLDTTQLANASYTFTVDATATDGSKASATSTAKVSNPTVAPFVVQQNLVDGQTVGGALSWTATTSGKTVSRVDFLVNGARVASQTTAPYAITFDTTQLANGSYPFTVVATATDGSTASATSTAKVSNPTVAPFVVQQNLVDGQTVGGALSWTATTSGKTVSRVDFLVNGSRVASQTTAPYAISFDTTQLANGSYPFTVQAVATDGTTAAATATVNVVNSAPASPSSFSVTQNVSNGLTLSGTYGWNATPSGGKVNKVSFYIDGKKVATKPNTPYATSVDTTRQPDGKHTFQVTALAADGSTASASASVAIANHAPPTSSTFGVTQSLADGQSLGGSVSWTATPTGQSASKVEFYVDGRLSWTERYSPYVYGGDGNTLDTTTLSNGRHALGVRAYAADGTTATSTAKVWVSNGGKSAGGAASGSTSGATTNTSGTASGTSSSGSGTSNGGSSSPNTGAGKGAGNGSSGSGSDRSLVSSIRDGQTISGSVTWIVNPRGFDVSTMEFFIDSKLMWTERLAPYVYGGDDRQLDTTTLTPGMHELVVRATGTDGSARTLTLHVTVK